MPRDSPIIIFEILAMRVRGFSVYLEPLVAACDRGVARFRESGAIHAAAPCTAWLCGKRRASAREM
ncbi:hypothetical protein ACVBGC_11190 [Burkholderia stagnalis]